MPKPLSPFWGGDWDDVDGDEIMAGLFDTCNHSSRSMEKPVRLPLRPSPFVSFTRTV